MKYRLQAAILLLGGLSWIKIALVYLIEQFGIEQLLVFILFALSFIFAFMSTSLIADVLKKRSARGGHLKNEEERHE